MSEYALHLTLVTPEQATRAVAAQLPTLAYVREALSYNEQTGVFRWKSSSRNGFAGRVAGSKTLKGYLTIWLGQTIFAHRLAWFYVHGEWPDAYIDHIDCNRQNNALSNLRVVSNKVNSENRRVPMKGKSEGLPLGVTIERSGLVKAYRSRITHQGVTHQLGTYSTPEAAHAAYVGAKRRLHEGCTL